MTEQELDIQQPEDQEEGEPTPRRTWERPVLQQLHISMDTAFGPGSDMDAMAAGAPFVP